MIIINKTMMYGYYYDIIISLEKLIKRGFFYIFGSSTLNKIIGFASSWIIVRIISKSDYGVYTHAYNIYGFLLLLNGLGISSAVLQLGSEAKYEIDKTRIYGYGIKSGLIVNTVLSLIIILIGIFIPLKISGSNQLLQMMMLLPVFTIITDLQLMYLRINLKNKKFAQISTINSCTVLIFSCLFAYFLEAPGLVIAGYCSHLLTAIIANRIFKVPLGIKNVKLSKREKKFVYSISMISMVNNGLSHLMYILDIFIIGMIISDSEVIASYKIATNIPTALQFIPSSLVLFVYPYFAKNKDNREWVIKSYIKMIIPFGIFNVIVSLMLMLFAKPIIIILFKEQYLDAVIPFRILCISYFFSATFRSISGNLLVTQRQLKFNLFVSIFAGLLNAILNILLIRSLQVNGAALATLVTTFICGLLSTLYFIIYVSKKRDTL